MVNIISSSRYKINRKLLREHLLQTVAEKGLVDNFVINLVFVGKKKMKDVSKKYKAEDVALPVLTFRYNEKAEGKNLVGEILICYPQAVLLAAQRGKKVDDMILQLLDHAVNNLFQN